MEMSQTKIWNISVLNHCKGKMQSFQYKKRMMRLEVLEVKSKSETCSKKTQTLQVMV